MNIYLSIYDAEQCFMLSQNDLKITWEATLVFLWRYVLSADPDASRVKSGEKVTDMT
jgi:hypothetical protein